MIEWIDSHCHLDGFDRRGHLPEILQRANEAGVKQMIAVGTGPEDWAWGKAAAQQHPQRIFYTAGLHPNYVSENWESDLKHLEGYLSETGTPPVAWGEIGLDFYRLPSDQSEREKVRCWQIAAFRNQLALFKQSELPIIIHSRHCFEETFSMIRESGLSGARFVFHCYSYGVEEIRRLNAIGARASFTGNITYKTAEAIRDAAIAQGAEKLMIETDCPYLAPVPHRGETNEPAYLAETGKYCAALFNATVEDFSQQLARNTRNFFRLP